MLNVVVEQNVTAALELRSTKRRERYLAGLEQALLRPSRQHLGCPNLARVLAAQPDLARLIIKRGGLADQSATSLD